MRITILLTLCLALLPLPGFAAALPASGTFVYSNACISEGGDFGGYRVILRPDRGALRVTVEFNDDGPDGRDSGRGVHFDPVSGRLRFFFRGGVDGDRHSFAGTVSPARLAGRFDDYDLTLPRLLKAPKELPDC